MKCPFRIRVIFQTENEFVRGAEGNYSKPVIAETNEEFLDCIGEDCAAYQPMIPGGTDRITIPEGCRMAREIAR